MRLLPVIIPQCCLQECSAVRWRGILRQILAARKALAGNCCGCAAAVLPHSAIQSDLVNFLRLTRIPPLPGVTLLFLPAVRSVRQKMPGLGASLRVRAVVNRVSKLSLPCGLPSLTQQQHRLAVANGRAAITAGDKATGAKGAPSFRRVGCVHPFLSGLVITVQLSRGGLNRSVVCVQNKGV
jgi:hypothetical protein